jgi:hypothetical protein
MTRENKLERFVPRKFLQVSLTLASLPMRLPIKWGKVDFSMIRTHKTRPKKLSGTNTLAYFPRIK